MAPMRHLSGSLNPLLASIDPKIQEIDFCDCLASDLGWRRTHVNEVRPHEEDFRTSAELPGTVQPVR